MSGKRAGQTAEERQRAADTLYMAELEQQRDRCVTQIEQHRAVIEKLGGKLEGLQHAIEAYRKTRPPPAAGESA